MDFESIRPVVSGVIGGTIAVWLSVKWARRVPLHDRPITATQLGATHKVAIYTANILFFAGLGLGLFLYTPTGGFEHTDWIPMGLGFGGGCTSALAALVLIPFLRGQRVSDSLVAYAISQQGPMAVIYGTIGFGVVAFVAAFIALLS